MGIQSRPILGSRGISPQDSFRKQIIFRMRFGRSIVGAATVAVTSAATHPVHHPNQRTFRERQGFGAQADFQAGDAFGVNANLNVGNPLADNQFIMPIIVGLGVLSVLNIATDTLGLAFNDDEEKTATTPKPTEETETPEEPEALDSLRELFESMRNSDTFGHFSAIMENMAQN